ncbi:PAS domain-containing sensor histidine kinase [Geomonas agri]|uniref:PAS domain-containing sensor histidine kinase n=1 Tax=Geomonas agri TaxID=2873702 RepID=UPI001CD6E6E7|nr:PAS domain S-box protein [Geomonas agri]
MIPVTASRTSVRRVKSFPSTSNDNFRLFFTKASLPAVLTKLPEHTFIDANHAFLKLFGYTKEELRGRTFVDVCISREAEEWGPVLAALARRRSVVNLEQTLYARSGQPVTVLTNVNVITMAEGEYALTTLQNITERKRTEEALRAGAARLKHAYQAAHAGAWEWNTATNETVWSEGLWKLYGLSPRSCKPSYDSWRRAVHPEDRDRIEQTVREAVRSRGEIEVEWRVWDQEESERWLLSRGRPLTEDGPIYIGVVFDISEQKMVERELLQYRRHLEALVEQRTRELEERNAALLKEVSERKKTEEALRRSESRYRDLFENSMDAILVAGPNGTILAANGAACDMFGMTEAEFRARGRKPLIHPEERRLMGFLRERAVLGKVRRELTCLRKDGTPFIAEISSVLLDDSGGSFVNLRDISERKRHEEKITALNAGLDQRVRERTAELEEAIREQEAFSYSVSHDLRAPLRHINSYSSMIEEDYGEQLCAEARTYLHRIQGASSRMGSMIDQLLELSRMSRATMVFDSVDLSELVRQALRMFRETEPQREVEAVVQEQVMAWGDRSLLRQLIENLIGNAWKYTAKKEQARIEFGTCEKEGEQVIFVQDNGAGFDMAYRHKLFRAFERLHGSAEFDGAGIGLATSHRIVKRHGGRIWAEGKVGEGATFYFTIPGKRDVEDLPKGEQAD